MLSDMTPEQMEEWIAMDRIIPLGDEKLAWVLANVGAALVSRLNLLCQAWGIKDLKDAKPRDFIPWLKKKKAKRKQVNPNQAVAMVRSAVGQWH